MTVCQTGPGFTYSIHLITLLAPTSFDPTSSESDAESDTSDDEVAGEEERLTFGHLPDLEPTTLIEPHLPSANDIPYGLNCTLLP
jgi:hypothetical protein